MLSAMKYIASVTTTHANTTKYTRAENLASTGRGRREQHKTTYLPASLLGLPEPSPYIQGLHNSAVDERVRVLANGRWRVDEVVVRELVRGAGERERDDAEGTRGAQRGVRCDTGHRASSTGGGKSE